MPVRRTLYVLGDDVAEDNLPPSSTVYNLLRPPMSRPIRNREAFKHLLIEMCGSAAVFQYALMRGPTVEVHVTKELPPDQEAELTRAVQEYKDPSSWWTLHSTENLFLGTPLVNSQEPTVVQTFIVSPPSSDTAGVLDSIKTMLLCQCTDVRDFEFWNSDNNNTDDAAGPASGARCWATIELYDLTQMQTVVKHEQSLDDVCSEWRALAVDKHASGKGESWKAVQLYGLKGMMPGADAVWQFKLHVSNPMISVSLNGMQKLYYMDAFGNNNNNNVDNSD